MDTDALILALARKTAAVPPHAAERRLGIGISLGALAALLVLIGAIGVRPDLQEVAGTAAFWAKAGYTLSLGLVGVMLVRQLAYPDTAGLRGISLIAAPVGLLLIFAGIEIVGVAPAAAAGLASDPAWTCVPLIAMLSVLIFAGLVGAFRRLAPTRLRAAGAAAGLAASGIGATVYCLTCLQFSPTYILTRYTFAIALVSAAGALLGPRLLRW